jgi:hypothetical protein
MARSAPPCPPDPARWCWWPTARRPATSKFEGAKEIAPNELRGGTIVGGRTFELSPGDVLWIPAGMGHQVVVPKGGSFDYLAVKFEAKPAP